MKQAHSLKGGVDVTLKRVRRTFEPSDKDWNDECLDVNWDSVDVSDAARHAMANVFFFPCATRVQSRVIPVFRQEGSSVVVEAATGSGKTLAFLIPMLDRLLRRCEKHLADHQVPLLTRNIVAAVVSPSRVLSQQTFVVARSLACRYPFGVHFVLCDKAVERLEQTAARIQKAARGGGAVVVGCAADLCALCALLRGEGDEGTEEGDDACEEDPKQGSHRPSKRPRVEGEGDGAPAPKKSGDCLLGGCSPAPFVLVIDEADVVLQNSTSRSQVTSFVQTVLQSNSDSTPLPIDYGLFGATAGSSPAVLDFLRTVANRPKDDPQLHLIVQGSDESFASKLTNKYIQAPREDILQTLVHLLNIHPTKMHLCFFNNVDVLLFVKEVLEVLLSDAAHSMLHVQNLFAMHQHQKDAAKYAQYNAFLAHAATLDAPPAAAKKQKGAPPRTGGLLLCTDVAAFGLDVRCVSYVYHFEVPVSVQSYVHRIGRVARMGMSGTSILLLPHDENEDESSVSRFLEELRKAHPIEAAALPSACAPLTHTLRGIVDASPELSSMRAKALAAKLANKAHRAEANEGSK